MTVGFHRLVRCDDTHAVPVCRRLTAFFTALVYITDTANYPLQTYIQQLNVDITEVTDPDKLEQLARISSRTLNSAKIVVSTIPLLMIYPFMQKYFVSGIVVGSVKE